jgi:hypothetical protein
VLRVSFLIDAFPIDVRRGFIWGEGEVGPDPTRGSGARGEVRSSSSGPDREGSP